MDEVLPRIVADAAGLHSQCSLARLIDGQSIEAQIDRLSDNVAAFLRHMAILLAQFSIRNGRSISTDDLERPAISRTPFECMEQAEQLTSIWERRGAAVAEQMVDLRQSVWQVSRLIEERSDKFVAQQNAGRYPADDPAADEISGRTIRFAPATAAKKRKLRLPINTLAGAMCTSGQTSAAPFRARRIRFCVSGLLHSLVWSPPTQLDKATRWQRQSSAVQTPFRRTARRLLC
jgi:hypothetical protein